MRCFCCVSDALRALSSAVTVLSWVSRSPRVRCVMASSERSCATEDGEEMSVVAGPLPFDVVVFVDALDAGTGSSAEDIWFANCAVLSASLVSIYIYIYI